MPSHEIRKTAAPLSELARRSHKFHARHVEVAIVRTVGPLTAELVDGGLTIGEDMLVLGSTARQYDRDHGLKAGDGLAVVRLSSDDYVALEVFSDAEHGSGIATALSSGSTKTLHGSGSDPQGGTVDVDVPWSPDHWMEVFDAAGVRVGWVPVFTSKT